VNEQQIKNYYYIITYYEHFKNITNICVLFFLQKKKELKNSLTTVRGGDGSGVV